LEFRFWIVGLKSKKRGFIESKIQNLKSKI